MAYCPEDGVELQPVCVHFCACYDCPECGLHWAYDGFGGYIAVSRSACPVHLRCDRCWEDSGREFIDLHALDEIEDTPLRES
jgi:hypothetical protein